MNRSSKSLLAGVAVAGLATILAGAPAHATPTVNVDGVTIPVGIAPGGIAIATETLVENVISGSGQSLQGVGLLNTIAQGVTTFWQASSTSNVAITFSGFTSDSFTAPTASTAGSITFTGGLVNFYAFNGPLPALDNTGSILTDFNHAQSGKLFLSLAAAHQDTAGHTLLVTLPAGASSNNFAGAGGTLFLDVTGGDAAANFKTCTFTNAFDTNGCSDILFTEDSSTHKTASDFNDASGIHVEGTGHANVNTVPEPATLGLLGTGLFGLAWVSRKRRVRN